MPLSTDAQVVETSKGLVATLRNAAGPNPGFRPGSSPCITRSRTPHKAFATQHKDTNKTHHSTRKRTTAYRDFYAFSRVLEFEFCAAFQCALDANHRALLIVDWNTEDCRHRSQRQPARHPEFLEFLRAATGENAGEAVPEFLGKHPETVRFLEDPKPSPVSFGTQHYFGVNAFKFVKKGKVTVFRYRIVPVSGEQYVSEEELKTKSESYLFDELPKRLESGPIEFKLLAQIAEDGDVTDDATVMWPEERPIVELGLIKVEKTLNIEESLVEQKHIIFDPIPRVEGVEVTDDPLLDVRASVYLISGKQRREEKDVEVSNVAQSVAVKSAT
jgi:catalase